MLQIFTEEAEWDVFIYSSIYPSFCATSTNKYVNEYIYIYTYIYIFFKRGHPVVFEIQN